MVRYPRIVAQIEEEASGKEAPGLERNINSSLMLGQSGNSHLGYLTTNRKWSYICPLTLGHFSITLGLSLIGNLNPPPLKCSGNEQNTFHQLRMSSPCS